ncbi:MULTISPECIES: maleylpyruvate isomerase family mycothiol-dependent enzyme [unclassified Amycolatopsis]|uniref:maleylpyruvate isomerase family mycothiol-dependent enzyme n=1 Tax=unclassified Amycolatopsis TaxID=2618356 RepID=UPI002875020D|nr:MULTISPECIES: maleylpyruvate isomerase family mycothiol-dependent enzyme [unclassified Amycolatopsis]MDS0134168.1 maleylpyruvate isomerase family mycothiol-dependent enzyme [Amycolatopsis sp. 505]MDS0146891.1 maleylpyruvate isomerase family mycothiol-dependent enzyme [Amycolatopsis sp. CM201R]
MTQLVDRTIAALRSEHDTLADLVRGLTDEQLAAPSGAAEWTVAQVLSHLGSGAEIGRAPLARAAGETVAAEENQAIWARWDASAPRAQAEGFLEHNARWLETVEALTLEQRSSLTVDLGFLPEPVPLVTALGLRLNEVANHSWDVRVAFDETAGVAAGSADVVVELLAGPVGFMLNFLAKPAELAEPVSVAVPGAGLVIDDAVTVVDHLEGPTATFGGPAEAFVRLVNGRLKAPYDKGVTVEGRVTLDELRRVFPGF